MSQNDASAYATTPRRTFTPPSPTTSRKFCRRFTGAIISRAVSGQSASANATAANAVRTCWSTPSEAVASLGFNPTIWAAAACSPSSANATAENHFSNVVSHEVICSLPFRALTGSMGLGDVFGSDYESGRCKMQQKTRLRRIPLPVRDGHFDLSKDFRIAIRKDKAMGACESRPLCSRTPGRPGHEARSSLPCSVNVQRFEENRMAKHSSACPGTSSAKSSAAWPWSSLHSGKAVSCPGAIPVPWACPSTAKITDPAASLS